MLEGTLRVRVGDDQVEVPAGGAVIAPAGTAHTFWNPGPEPARYVLVMGVRTYALIQALHASDDRGPVGSDSCSSSTAPGSSSRPRTPERDPSRKVPGRGSAPSGGAVASSLPAGQRFRETRA